MTSYLEEHHYRAPEEAQLKKGYVDTKFGQVHYYMEGTEGPLLFLFHETALSANEFELTLPYLARHCRAVALDTPGYGMSDPPSAPLTMGEIAERMVAAIDSFSDGPCALAGAHTGASIALDLAAHTLSHRMTHLVLTGISLINKKMLRAAIKNVGERQIQRDGSHLMDGWNDRIERWGKAKNTDDLDMVQWGLVEGLRVFERSSWAFHAVLGQDAESALKKLACPTYFLVGEFDSLTDNDVAATKLVPGSKLNVLAGKGGRLPYAEPELYAEEVLGFMGLRG
jgi:pimeloyl-ACP methyl ester carboxylesterase